VTAMAARPPTAILAASHWVRVTDWLCAYISLGVHRKIYSRHVLRIPHRHVILLSAGIRISRQIS
jgi:hypothetical protein